MQGVTRRPGGLLLLFGAVSLAAVLTGAYVCAVSDVPTSSWIRNIVAWAVGAALAVGIARIARPGFSNVAPWAAPVVLLATLVSPDQEGVHRWIDLGPLHINVAMLLLPAAIVALAVSAEKRLPWIAILLSLGVLAFQPDASQATTLAVVGGMVAMLAAKQPLIRWGVPVVAAALAVAAWLQPDPLQPVAEVEGIVGLALSVSPLLAELAVLLLVAVAAVPALGTKRLAGLALSLCFLLWAIMPLLGAYPVPFVGVGMSPILGGWLGVGLLAAAIRWNGEAGQAKSA